MQNTTLDFANVFFGARASLLQLPFPDQTCPPLRLACPLISVEATTPTVIGSSVHCYYCLVVYNPNANVPPPDIQRDVLEKSPLAANCLLVLSRACDEGSRDQLSRHLTWCAVLAREKGAGYSLTRLVQHLGFIFPEFGRSRFSSVEQKRVFLQTSVGKEGTGIGRRVYTRCRCHAQWAGTIFG